MGTAIRRAEIAGLRWRSVFLADPAGPYIRVEETWVRHATDTPKSDAGNRTISIGEKIATELFEHRRWSVFKSDDDYVFPTRGQVMSLTQAGTRRFCAKDYGGLVSTNTSGRAMT